jgi:hypothetical protein
MDHLHQLRGYSILTVIHVFSPVLETVQAGLKRMYLKVRSIFATGFRISASGVQQGIECLFGLQGLPHIPN